MNNVGIMITKPIDKITEEDFHKLMAINVKETFFCMPTGSKTHERHSIFVNIQLIPINFNIFIDKAFDVIYYVVRENLTN